MRDRDGRLWFANGSVVQMVDPAHMVRNFTPPPVHLEQIIADHKMYLPSGGVRFRLHRARAMWKLSTPRRVLLSRKEFAFDTGWKAAIRTGKEKRELGASAFYTDLRPGAYRFRVIAANNSGVWNEAGAFLDFSIDPAYYQTTWFRASCVAAFFAVLWALYRYRLYQIKQEFNANLEGRVDERVRIARELHDTLLQTVQGLMLRLQVVDEMLPPGKAKEELEETLEVGDQAIIEGRNTVRDLRTHLNTKLPSALRALGDELASTSEATFRVIVEGPILNLNPIVRDELYRIAREALRNAFAHARAKHIEVEITYKDSGCSGCRDP